MQVTPTAKFHVLFVAAHRVSHESRYNRNGWLGVKHQVIYGSRIWYISLIKTRTQSWLLVTFNSAASRNWFFHTFAYRLVRVFSFHPKPNLSALFVRICSFQHRLTVKVRIVDNSSLRWSAVPGTRWSHDERPFHADLGHPRFLKHGSWTNSGVVYTTDPFWRRTSDEGASWDTRHSEQYAKLFTEPVSIYTM